MSEKISDLREIKFRMWLPTMHQFVYEFEMNSKGNLITLQQYTGLKDKNGVEIYEGDIVKDVQVAVVKFSNDTNEVGSCGCCYGQFDGSGFIGEIYPGEYVNLSDCKIVGNIYENPELLEKK